MRGWRSWWVREWVSWWVREWVSCELGEFLVSRFWFLVREWVGLSADLPVVALAETEALAKADEGVGELAGGM